MSLRHRLLALIALLLVASLLGGGLLTYWHGLKKIELEMSSAISVGDNAMRDAVMPLLPGPITENQIARVVSSFDGDRHVRASLLAPTGEERLQSRVRKPGEPPPRWLSQLLTGPLQTARLELPDALGTIQLQADPLNEITEVWDDAKLKLAIVGGFCLLVIGMISVTLERALKPLESLSLALQKVGSGDYDVHVSERGPEELSAIYRGFNTMATTLSSAEQKNRQLNEQLSTVQDEERAEIARDLHDEIGPFLFAVDVDAQTIPTLLTQAANADVIQRATAIRQSVGHMQAHLRSILQRLRPETLLDLGLTHAADQLSEFWRERYPAIEFSIDCTDESFGMKVDEAAFRIFQEGTSNAVRHGKPTRIWLSARRTESGALAVCVTDDGVGIRTSSRKELGRSGLGLTGMRDRIALLGGTMTIDTGPDGRGVALRAVLPPTDLTTPQHNEHDKKGIEGRI